MTYALKKYAGPASRITCPSCGRTRCFVPYVDEAGEILDPTCGRCNHETHCGYHLPPSEFFRLHPELRPGSQDWREDTPGIRATRMAYAQRKKEPDELPRDLVMRTVTASRPNHFLTFLRHIFPEDKVLFLVQEYYIGVTREAGTVFYQIDSQGRFRGGKIMRYDPETGHRIKDVDIPVDWVHTRLKRSGHIQQAWELSQCLFGEHLIRRYPERLICLVEAEKTAIIAAGFMPEYLWLATGGKTQLGDKLDVLRGRHVLAIPDIDAYDTWKQRFAARRDLSVQVSDLLFREGAPETLGPTADLADWLIWSEINSNPNSQLTNPTLL